MSVPRYVVRDGLFIQDVAVTSREGRVSRNLFQKGRIDWDYYSAEYDRIENELKELLQASQAPEQKKDFTYLENLLQEDFKSIYQKLSPENRQAFWRSTIHEIHLKEDYTVDCVDFL